MTDITDQKPLTTPWLVAVWPGMGHVAVNAGVYLASKLEMGLFAEFSPRDLFDADHVDVQQGIIHAARMPRNRVFLWHDPDKKHDLLLFIGEAQPPNGKRAFCRSLIELARQLGVERVFTFAAMATQMHPEHSSHVYVAGTDQAVLEEISKPDVEVLQDGNIGGLNGILLGEVAEAGMRGACLLGEMPHIFAQLPFPGGSLGVLKVFREIFGIPIDLEELEQQTKKVGLRLGEMLAQVEEEIKEREAEPDNESFTEEEPVEQPRLSPKEESRIEELFQLARGDRSKAYELKQELDRLQVFSEYEDRFLDLFHKTD